MIGGSQSYRDTVISWSVSDRDVLVRAKMSSFEHITSARPLLLVGGGRMGSAMLDGWLAGPLSAAQVVVIEQGVDAAAQIAARHDGLRVLSSVIDLNVNPSVAVLAVKPQVMDAVLAQLTGLNDALFISIAAGRTLESITALLANETPIIRTMPNTPAAIGQGMNVCVANAHVTPPQRDLCTGLLDSVGQVTWIEDEGLMDAVTALSGSGPAYVFHLVEAMAAAGESLGLPPDLAETLARQTIVGSGALVAQSSEGATVLRQNVTSPGGTTEAALDVLIAENGLVPLMRAAMEAAARRSKDLSG